MTSSNPNVIDFPAPRFRQEQTPVYELDSESILFIDWLTIRQAHEGGGLPLVIQGYKFDTEEDGEINYQIAKRRALVGSYDDTMHLRCDGNTIEFHGNISRWERPDNVFGYSWDETIRRVNQLLNLYSLPPFTVGQRLRFADKGHIYTGARVSRIDITKNFACFSEQDARQYMLKMAGHHIGRQKGSVTPDGMTIEYGRGSKYVYGKLYMKHAELESHRKRKSGSHVGQDVVDFCRSVGIVREEMELKSRFLTQQQICWLAQINSEVLEEIYRERSQVRGVKNMSYEDTTELSSAARGTLARYEKGEPLNLSRPTFYRHRNELLKAGYPDIGIANNVVALRPNIKVIEVQAMCAPDWYRKKYG